MKPRPSARNRDSAKNEESAESDPIRCSPGVFASGGTALPNAENSRSKDNLRSGVIHRFRITLLFIAASLLTILLATSIVVHKTGELATDNFMTVVEADAFSDLGHLMRGVRTSIAAKRSHDGVADTVHNSLLGTVDESENIVLSISDIASLDALPEWILWSKSELKYSRAVIYDLTGEVAWSDEPVAAHGPLAGRPLFLSALAGNSASELEIYSVFAGTEAERKTYVAEVYLPLRSTPAGPIVGVAELYTDVTDQYSALVINTINDARTTTLITMVGLFTVLAGFVIASDVLKFRAHQRELAQKQALNDVRSEFLSTVSHELRTPLTTMLAFSDVLRHNRDGNLTERQLDQLKLISKGGQQLNELIDDLLDVSRSETGQFRLELAPFDIKETIEEVAHSCKSVFEERRQTLKLVNLREPTWMNGDRVRIKQVFSNLLTNAAKYSPDGSLVEVDVVNEGDWVQATVRDHGIGISDADQLQLFVPFHRVDNEETRKESGTGLGLAIVKTIVELHGGRIELESQPGVGTTVRTWFGGILVGPASSLAEVDADPAATS